MVLFENVVNKVDYVHPPMLSALPTGLRTRSQVSVYFTSAGCTGPRYLPVNLLVTNFRLAGGVAVLEILVQVGPHGAEVFSGQDVHVEVPHSTASRW